MTTKMAIGYALAVAACAVVPACSGDDAEGSSNAADGFAGVDESAKARFLAQPASVRCNRRYGDDCGQPEAPSHGIVFAPWTCNGGMALYGCADGFTLMGESLRTCEADGNWSGTAPTCRFAGAGSACGNCGGKYNDDGTCSDATSANGGAPCDVGSGQGACAQAGTVACDGTCQPVDPTVGNATEWHITPAANGSWDWDCDGVVTMTLAPTIPPPACSAYAEMESCNAAPTVEYVTESTPCGEQATLFRRDCDWKTLGPTCLDTPASHRTVFQQCR